MAFFPTSTGSMFEGMNPFGARPSDALTGILTDQDTEKLKNQALLSGILGTGLTYLAQPKNQGIGIPAILAKSYLGGMTQSQNAYDTALSGKVKQLELAKTAKQIETEGMSNVAKLMRDRDALKTTDPTYTEKYKFLSDALTKEARPSYSDPVSQFEYAKANGYKGDFPSFKAQMDDYQKQMLYYNTGGAYNPNVNTMQPKTTTNPSIIDSTSVKAPNGLTYKFNTIEEANAFRQKIGSR